MIPKVKFGLLLLPFFLILFGLAACSPQEKERKQMNSLGKTAIVYYTYTGTNQKVAKELQQLTGGDLYEIRAQEPYDSDSYAASDRVFEERRTGKLPAIKGQLPDLTKYDTILIGSPVWNDSLANPIMTYLRETDFQGKRVAPYWTYITSQGSTARDFQEQIRHAKQEKGLALRTNQTQSQLRRQLSDWLTNFR